MTGESTLPGCFAIGKPIPPNRCQNCPYRADCRKYVRKEDLKPILAKIEEIEAIIKR